MDDGVERLGEVVAVPEVAGQTRQPLAQRRRGAVGRAGAAGGSGEGGTVVPVVVDVHESSCKRSAGTPT